MDPEKLVGSLVEGVLATALTDDDRHRAAAVLVARKVLDDPLVDDVLATAAFILADPVAELDTTDGTGDVDERFVAAADAWDGGRPAVWTDYPLNLRADLVDLAARYGQVLVVGAAAVMDDPRRRPDGTVAE